MPLIVSVGGSSGKTPGVPTIGTATAGNGQATVTFSPPTYLGKPTATTYTAISNPSNITATSGTSPITVTGLSNGTSYTFAVNLSNGLVTSINSSSSNSVVPVAPPPPPPSFGPWFTPPPFFGPWFYVPGCIDAETLISVVGPDESIIYKEAQDIVVGDIIWAPTYTEYSDESLQNPEEWEAEMLSSMQKVQTTVVSVVPKVKETLYFNNDTSNRISIEQLMLLKPQNEMWQYLYASEANIGDTFMTYSPDANTFAPTQITEITLDADDPREVYAISVEDTDLFIAGNIVVHNK
jgi:hypothetical protein